MPNFDFLQTNPLYASFAKACIDAEKGFLVSYETAAIHARKALELAVKWLYSHDDALSLPYDTTLSALIHHYSFKDLIDMRHFKGIKFIKELGNKAVHNSTPVQKEQAVWALKSLYGFISWIDYCYSETCHNTPFDESLLPDSNQEKRTKEQLGKLFERLSNEKQKLEEAREENEKLRKEMAALRQKNTRDSNRTYRTEDLSEFKTRKIYIDLDLETAGWTIGNDCIEEVEVSGMPNNAETGYVDYVLYGDGGIPLAVVEAKRTSVDPRKGRIQAKLYADCLEKQHNYRPVIFYTNGFDTYIWDDEVSAEREVSGFYTRDDLEWLSYKRKNRKPLKNIDIKENITNRAYQKMAIQSVCEAFEQGHTKALLVMATGSGKTRTAISMVDVLLRFGWVKHILFLADRRELVKQAKSNFKILLPELSLCNLLDSKDSAESKMVFSTYPTMMNAIDETKDKTGKRLFSPGHFDLIIVDESHRSIYKKYKDIFTYFDAALVGLTATPKSDIHKDTYAIFDLEKNVPTFAYDMEEAVAEGYLVPYQTVETRIKLPEEGIHYNDLSEEEKEHFEETFDEEVTEVKGDEINRFLFNEQTVDIVLEELMTKGLKIEGGDKLGKTIIFAKNKTHAEFILKRFNIRFPKQEYAEGFAQPIYTGIKYVDQIYEDFTDGSKYPQIAISVDMLDTGVDVPEILNLVFFKKVRSIAKFKQMIGRGTRLCPDLLGVGEDKEMFRIFDYCQNFEFFRQEKKAPPEGDPESLSSRLFNIKTRLIKELQLIAFQENPDYGNYRKKLVVEQLHCVNKIDETHFSARMRIEYIHKYKNKQAWKALGDTDLIELKENIADRVPSLDENEMAKRFDLLIYTIEYATLGGFSDSRSVNKVIETAEKLSEKSTISQIASQKEIIEKVIKKEFWDSADIFQQEEVRIALRELLMFLDSADRKPLYTHFEDKIIASEIRGMDDYTPNREAYKKKVEHYLKEHIEDRNLAIYKLRNNLELTKKDIETLENILWHDLGTKEEYQKEYGETPLLQLVLKIVGLDQKAAEKAFSRFLSDTSLNKNQMEFVRMIVRFVVENGVLEKQILNESPFDKFGSIVELFDGKKDVAVGIIAEIDRLNERVR